MTEDKGTPHSEDRLRIVRGTDPDDVREFIKRRTKSPVVLDSGITVWNYGTHVVDHAALAEVEDTLQRTEYVIPYPVPGAWGYMQDVLPQRLREAELLVYSLDDERYKAYTNLRRVSNRADDAVTAVSLKRWLREEFDG